MEAAMSRRWRHLVKMLAIIGLLCLVSSTAVSAEQDVAITYSPSKPNVDKLRQVTVCSGAPYDANSPTSINRNETGKTLGELLGHSVTAIRVHYFSSDWKDFDEVSRYLRTVFASRPNEVYQYSAWAEGTSFKREGIIGVVEFDTSNVGVFEVAGRHLCVQDELGHYWWTRDIPDPSGAQ